jgi:hypothetical protein
MPVARGQTTGHHGTVMDQQAAIAVFTIAAFVGLTVVALLILRRGRTPKPPEESPFAASIEGMSACPRCSRANFPFEAACLYCGAPLTRHRDVG